MNDNYIVPVWKPQGWTPLEALVRYKKNNPLYAKETISYAGRLDPMAEGVLLLLVSIANKQRARYEKLSKTYESEFVLGIETDSLDALGMVTHSKTFDTDKKTIELAMNAFVGKQTQKYPIYSSRTVGGKPLYWWARQGRISEISIPEKMIEISSILLLDINTIKSSDLYKTVTEKIERVTGNFRQQQIFAAWSNFLMTHPKGSFIKVSIQVSCSSGTYIRQLVSDVGEKLGCGAFALSIIRTQVGEYTKEQCEQLV